jgi:hypothetical protein
LIGGGAGDRAFLEPELVVEALSLFLLSLDNGVPVPGVALPFLAANHSGDPTREPDKLPNDRNGTEHAQYLLVPVEGVGRERRPGEEGGTLARRSLPLRAHYSGLFWGTGS